MTPNDAPETLELTQLAQIEADLADLSASVGGWMSQRFSTSEEDPAVSALDVVDVNGLVAWLGQWHAHFDRYGEAARRLQEAGRPAVTQRLKAIEAEIDRSIENLAQVAQSLPSPDQE